MPCLPTKKVSATNTKTRTERLSTGNISYFRYTCKQGTTLMVPSLVAVCSKLTLSQFGFIFPLIRKDIAYRLKLFVYNNLLKKLLNRFILSFIHAFQHICKDIAYNLKAIYMFLPLFPFCYHNSTR